MPVFTFSTPETKPIDTEAVKKVKEYCNRRNLNFSAVVVELIKQYEREVAARDSKKA